MTIFKNKKQIDKYKDKTVVLNSIRTNVPTAVKIDELVQVCRAETGNSRLSKNKFLTSIVTSFINDIETTASTNESKATQKLLAILEN